MTCCGNRWRSRTQLQFIEESHFRSDLTAILGRLTEASWSGRLTRRLAAQTSGGMLSSLAATWLLNAAPTTLFVVDDTVFLKPFAFSACSRRLLENNSCLAFSLRLGEGLTHFYMGNREQSVPAFTPVSDDDSLCEFDWTQADGDFAYPLEVSSSLLRSAFLLPRLLRKPWRSPNTLELALANMAGRYKSKMPRVLTFRFPRAVSVPLNMVQQDFADNRVGGAERYRPEALCELFLKGVQADLSRVEHLHPNSVHAECPLLPDIGP